MLPGRDADAPAGVFRWRWSAAISVALLGLMLAPARFAALRGDDAFMSETVGFAEGTGRSLWEVIGDHMELTVDEGRPQFLHVGILYLTHAVLGDAPEVYRLYLVGLTLACVLVTLVLLRRCGASPVFGLLAAVLMATTFQWRLYHDAQLGYLGLVQLLLLCTLASAFFLLRHLQDGRRRDLVLAFLLFAPCPLLYELSYPLVLVHVVLALRERGLAGLRAAAPFVLLALAFTVASLLLRQGGPEVPGSPYAISRDPLEIARTYLVMLVAPLPGAYPLLQSEHLTSPTAPELAGAVWRGLAVGLVVLAAMGPLRRALLRTSGAAAGRASLVGAGLLVAAPALLALAPKYQDELEPGIGYLPVLAQELGVALLLAAGLLLLARRLERAAPGLRWTAVGVAAAGAGLLAGLVGYNNLRVVASERPAAEFRALLEDAASAGTFDEAPAASTVVLDQRDVLWPSSWLGIPWAPEAMLLERADRRFDVRYAPNAEAGTCPQVPRGVWPPVDCGPRPRPITIVRVRAHRAGGTVITARVDRELAETARRFRVLVRGSQERPPLVTSVDAAGAPWRSTGTVRWAPLPAQQGWRRWEATVVRGPEPRATELGDPRATFEFTAGLQPPAAVRVLGTRAVLP